MRRARWPLLLLLLCTPLALLSIGFRPPWLASQRGAAQPRPVPPGDQELAWIHTTTNGAVWERFVTGLKRVEMVVPGLHVDDAEALLDQSTAVPEVVVGRDGHAGKLRIRWYKITSEVTPSQWFRALAAREPAPLAVIGGSSSDRALDLASGLARVTQWHGDRPLLLITTATADDINPDPNATASGGPGLQTQKLIDVYDGRSFRFCFTNRQMAEAVTDYVFGDPSLRPGAIVGPGLRMITLAAGGPWASIGGLTELYLRPAPHVFAVAWQDDPYSVDLAWQFRYCIHRRFGPDGARGNRPAPIFHGYDIPFGVGSFYAPNRYEAASVDAIVRELPPVGQRALLVLPTTPPPARRFIRALCEAAPLIDRRLVAVTGDGMGMNTIYRDGEFAWTVRSLTIPLVLFTHNDPFAWDQPGAAPTPPPGYALTPPNSTEDALLFAELGRIVVEAAFPSPEDATRIAATDGIVTRAEHLAARLRERSPPFFDAEGDRLGGTGEFVVVLRPNFNLDAGLGKPAPDASIDVYRRGEVGRPWIHVRTLPVVQTRRPEGGR